MRRSLPAPGPARQRLLATATALLLATGCDGPSEPTQAAEPPSPERLISELTDTLSPDDRYRDPDAGERSTARRAARSLLVDQDPAERDRLFGDLGFAVHRGTDPATDRPFDLYLATGSDDRTWGAVLTDRTAPPRSVIEVPHPGFDINTEKLGLALHRQVPGSVLLIAGAHRRAAAGAADVAHNDRSLFHVLAVELADNGLDQVQLHGFADQNLLGSDAVVSTGSAAVGPLAVGIADGLAAAGIETCRAWARRCGQLEGKTNQQGRAAAEMDGVFIHLELSWTVRRNATTWENGIAVLADQLNER